MSSSALPPLGNLPSWARISSLDRNRFPKPFLRDRLPTLPPTGNPNTDIKPTMVSFDDSKEPVGVPLASQLDLPVQEIDNLSPNEKNRLVYYNKTIKYLQDRHSDTLKKLHKEVEELKSENKDLQFKAVMKKPGVASSATNLTNATEAMKMREMRQLVKNAQARNNMLHFALRKLGINLDTKSPTLNIERSKSEEMSATSQMSLYDPERENSTELLAPLPTIVLPLGATINPLRVSDQGQKARIPTTEECDVIITHLHKSNLQQIEDNIQLRSDLRNLLFASNFVNNEQKLREKRSPLINEVNLSLNAPQEGTLPNLKPQYLSQADRKKKSISNKGKNREGYGHLYK